MAEPLLQAQACLCCAVFQLSGRASVFHHTAFHLCRWCLDDGRYLLLPPIQSANIFFSPGMTLKTITVNYPLQKNISEISTTVSMSSSVIKQSPMTLGLWLRYQIGWIIFRYWTFALCHFYLSFLEDTLYICERNCMMLSIRRKTVPCLVWTWLRQRFQVPRFSGLHSRFKTSLGHTAWSLKVLKS